MAEEYRIIFQVYRKRIWLIRTLMWAMLGMGGLFLSLILDMPIGEDPTVSRGEEIAIIILVMGLAIVFPLGMHVYGTCYVGRVISNEDESINYYDTIGWFGYRRWTIHKDEQGQETHHKGHSKGFYSASLGVTKMEVNAPYTSQKVKIRKLPFIFDDVGDWTIWPKAKHHEFS